MKTLAIHPFDGSTDFLTRVYEDLPDTTVVTGGVTRADLRAMVDDHDQVLMLGHGTGNGLLSVGRFPQTYGCIVDDTFHEVLSRKRNSVFIWCNADEYVRYNKLSGFYTGMFVSELGEMRSYRINGTYRDIRESNNTFAQIVGETLRTQPRAADLHRIVMDRYGELAKRNPVAQFNHERLYVTERDSAATVRRNTFDYEDSHVY